MLEPVVDYDIMLLYYSKRAMTNQGDAIRAMAGIIRQLSQRMKVSISGRTAGGSVRLLHTLQKAHLCASPENRISELLLGWLERIPDFCS
jgi:hypothetical protein